MLAPMEIRTVADDEIGAFRATMIATFAGDPDEDADAEARFRALIEPDRRWAAFDGGALVATAATFAFTLTVPGGALPMAGLTMVTVRPTHRRRGILRGLISAHLDDARRRGEPIGGLWASESGIYGRFGYGMAAEGIDLGFDASAVATMRSPSNAQ